MGEPGANRQAALADGPNERELTTRMRRMAPPTKLKASDSFSPKYFYVCAVWANTSYPQTGCLVVNLNSE